MEKHLIKRPDVDESVIERFKHSGIVIIGGRILTLSVLFPRLKTTTVMEKQEAYHPSQVFATLDLVKQERSDLRRKLDSAVAIIDDYLNAGFKEERTRVHEKAKIFYKEYYGVEYKNRIDR